MTPGQCYLCDGATKKLLRNILVCGSCQRWLQSPWRPSP